jgi:hypothetical protein
MAVLLACCQVQAMTLIEKYEKVEPGQWVKFKTTKRVVHYLLVAGKKENMLTIEEKITDRGFLTTWTQLDIDLEKKKVVAMREKDMVDGEIREYRQFNDSELEKILKIRLKQSGDDLVRKRVPAGSFKCRKYTGVYDDGQIIIFYADEIPLYPVKIAIHRYDKEIELLAYGQGDASQFFPPSSEIKSEDNNDTKHPCSCEK